MKITIQEDKRFNIPEHSYECNLVDDGTLDTVIDIDGTEHRYSWETGADMRNFDGSIIEKRFIELCKLTIENCCETLESDGGTNERLSG